MLVDDKLAKEKLARICENSGTWLTNGKVNQPATNYAKAEGKYLAQLIRNTDLTDCQPQPMENMSVTQTEVPPSLGDSGCPRCDGPTRAAEDLLDGYRRGLEGEELMRHARRRLSYWLIERRSPCEWWVGNYRISNQDGGEWTTDVSKALHFNDEIGATGHARDLEAWGIKGPLIATEHIDCDGPAPDQGSVRNATDMRERCAKAVPTSWLDPLLTGPDNVLGNAHLDCPAVERLLSAIAKRIRALPVLEAHQKD